MGNASRDSRTSPAPDSSGRWAQDLNDGPALVNSGKALFPFLHLLILLSLFGCATRPSLNPRHLSSLSWFDLFVSHTILTTRDGLAGNFVTGITRAPDGTLWIGTTTGATRVSGGRWTTFTAVHGLGDDWVTALQSAPDGRVWFGTHGGLSVFDGRQFTTYTLSNSQIPGNFITELAIDRAGTVWVGTLNSGIAAFDPGANRWTRDSLPNNSITGLAVDGANIVWAGTDGGGIFRFLAKEWQPVRIPQSHSMRVKQVSNTTSGVKVTMEDGTFLEQGGNWIEIHPAPIEQAFANLLGVGPDRLTSLLATAPGEMLAGSPRGLGILRVSTASFSPVSRSIFQGGLSLPAKPLPVVLVHGWAVSESDRIEDSEFRYLKSYAEQDGIQMFYAQGITPKNTLFQNALRLRDGIAEARKATGAERVNLLAFSMGGLAARIYLESTLYQGDVNRAIILGTPQSGVDIWKPILLEEMLQKPDEPSAIELTPEYAQLLNATQAPRASIPYDLLAGDARQQRLFQFIGDLPPNDGLISVDSALALDGPNVRHALNSDLHGYEPAGVPFHLTSYLYPRDTYERYLRNALRDPTNAPLGSEVALAATPAPYPGSIVSNHTPVVTAALAAGETVTRTVTIDANQHARFLAYFPGGQVNFSLRDPDGRGYSFEDQSIVAQVEGSGNVVSLNADIASFVGYSVPNATPGVWSLILKRTDKGSAPLKVTSYVDLDASQRLVAQVTPGNTVPGRPLTISASLAQQSDAMVTAEIAIPSAAPGGSFTFQDLVLAMNERGEYSAQFLPPRSGYYLVRVKAEGAGFTRGTEFLFSVSPGGAKLRPNPEIEVTHNEAGAIDRIRVLSRIDAARSGSFALAVTLRDPNSRIAARVVSPLQLSEGTNVVTIDLAGRDLAFPGPFSLDWTLLDTNWAALPIDGAENVATVQN